MRIRIGVNKKDKGKIEHGPPLYLEIEEPFTWADENAQIHELVKVAVERFRPGFSITGYVEIDEPCSHCG
jgi:hypothetical protein